MSSTSSVEEILAPYLSTEHIITNPISTLSTMFFLYGIYCVVFGLSIRVLFRHNGSAHKLYKGCTIALFILASIYTGVFTWGVYRQASLAFNAATTKNYTSYLQYGHGDDGKTAWQAIQNIVTTLMNSIADIMLVHRCYILFNYNKILLILLASVAFVLNGIDFGCVIVTVVGVGDSSRHANTHLVAKVQLLDEGVVICIVAFQIVLSFLTGGRIWWITSEARRLKAKSAHRFNVMVAIIIESALLYAGTLLASVILIDSVWVHNATGTIPIDFGILPDLISGLAPTMVIARVAYGKSVDSVQQELSTFRIADIQASQQRSMVPQQVIIDPNTPYQYNVGHWEEEDLRVLHVVTDAGYKV